MAGSRRLKLFLTKTEGKIIFKNLSINLILSDDDYRILHLVTHHDELWQLVSFNLLAILNYWHSADWARITLMSPLLKAVEVEQMFTFQAHRTLHHLKITEANVALLTHLFIDLYPQLPQLFQHDSRVLLCLFILVAGHFNLITSIISVDQGNRRLHHWIIYDDAWSLILLRHWSTFDLI